MSDFTRPSASEELSNSSQLLGSNTDNLYPIIDRDKSAPLLSYLVVYYV